jgi:hypothetical protein
MPVSSPRTFPYKSVWKALTPSKGQLKAPRVPPLFAGLPNNRCFINRCFLPIYLLKGPGQVKRLMLRRTKTVPSCPENPGQKQIQDWNPGFCVPSLL